MVQLRLFAPVTGWRPPELSSLPSWRGATRVSIDTETRDDSIGDDLGIGVRRGGYVVGISFSIDRPGEARRGWYLPIRHEGGGNLDPEAVLAYLRDQAAATENAAEIVGANLPYDLDYLEEAGVRFRPRRFRDIQVLEPLLDELQFSYSLQAVAERNGLAGKDEALLDQAARHFCAGERRGNRKWNPKAHIWRLPSRHVGPYAEVDALRPLEILEAQERRLAATDSADARVASGRAASLRSLWDLESRLLPVLLGMRRRGVRVDLPHLDVVEARCLREEEDACAAFSTAVGRRLQPSDLAKSAVVGPLIESALGLKLGRTETNKHELKAPKLRALHHPAVDLYLRARRFSKLRTTYVQQLRDHQVRGRVHCTFNQVKRAKDDASDDDEGTISGRVSATDPSLQNQPVRDPAIGAIWRKAYLADEGAEWACLDYSAQEPRWLIHFAAETRCTGAAEMRDAFRRDPATKLYEVLRDRIGWSGDEGKERTKTVYLGIAYGMGGPKLCRQLGKPTRWVETRSGRYIEVAGDEGQAVMDDFHRGAPFIRELNQETEKVAKRQGYVRTVLGRVCRFPRHRDGRPGYDWTHKATNRVVQGSSADQIKRAMVDADEAGIALQLQVHDELDLSVGDRRTSIQLAEIMLNAVPCSVPHLVKPEHGRSWGEVE